MITIGIALALACAFVANLGFFFKHRGVAQAPAVDIRHPFRTTRALWASRWFAIGMGLAGVAWVLHVAALAVAPITVVQVALAAGIVMIGAMADRIFGVTVGRRQWVGLALMTVGLVLLALTFPGMGEGAHSQFSAPTMAIFEGVLFAFGGLLILGPRVGAPAAHHGVMLAAAAGVLFAVSNVSIKALTGLAETGGVLGMALSPWLLVTLAASVSAFFASARALQDGDPVPVIAVTGITANITAIASGLIVFGDPLPGTTLGVVAQAAAMVLIVVSAALTPAPQGARSPAPAAT